MSAEATVAIALGGCDFGNSGVSVFAQALLPRLMTALEERGRSVVVLGTALERESTGLRLARGPILPAACNVPSVSAAFCLSAASALAKWYGAGVLYLPCANRRISGVSIVPVVGTVHDLAQFYVPQKYGPLRQMYVQRLLVPLLRRLRLVTTVSKATADDVVRYAGVAPTKIRVIPNGVSLSRPDTPVAPHARPYFLYPARLEHPGKNHQRLLRAFARAECRITHDLVFSGADWGARSMILETSRELGLSDRVHLLGFVDRAELASWMAGCDGVIAAGLCEGFGLPAAEGMSFGKVVVASNSGSLPEVVGQLGVLFDPLNVEDLSRALDRATKDSALREQCRAGGPERAARFSWDSSARDTANALCEAFDAAA